MDNDLIEAVYRREPIWNPAHKLHKKSNILKKLWEEVAVEVGRDARSSKTRWKNLRAYFVKECQKMGSRNVEGQEQSSGWIYFDQLQFLRLSSTVASKLAPCSQDGDWDGNEILITNLEDSPMTFQGQASPEHSSTDDELSIAIPETNIASGAAKDDILFFESLLPYMKKIPIERKLRLRSKIQDLISNELEASISDK